MSARSMDYVHLIYKLDGENAKILAVTWRSPNELQTLFEKFNSLDSSALLGLLTDSRGRRLLFDKKGFWIFVNEIRKRKNLIPLSMVGAC